MFKMWYNAANFAEHLSNLSIFSIKTTTSNNHLSLVNNIITNHLNIAIVTSVSLYNFQLTHFQLL